MTRSTARRTDIYVTSGQVLSGSSFTNADIFVEQGGTIAGDSLGANTLAEVEDGGSAVAISVHAGGAIYGSGGSILSHDTIYTGGMQTEGSDSYTSAITAKGIDTLVLSGGVDDVYDAGLSISATIHAGGLQDVFGGTASASVVERAGEVEVAFGSAAGITIERGGQLRISEDGSAGGVVMAGGIAIVQPDFYSPVTLSGLTIASGGTLVLIAGATEQGATIAAGGTLERASVVVYERSGADSLLIAAGDTLTQTLGFGVSAYVYSGGVLSAPIVGSGGEAEVYLGGLAIDPVVQSGGVLSFSSFGSGVQLASAIDPVVLNGGTLTASEANITGATIHSGGVAIIDGPYQASENGLVDTTILAGGLVSVGQFGVTDRTSITSGGELQVNSGTASNTLVNAGAALVVVSGSVENTLVQSGGQITVAGRGNDTFNGGKIEAGGTLTFVSGYAGHAFSNFVLGSGATLVEIAGGTEYGLTIDPGAIVISGNVGLFQNMPRETYYVAQNVERLLAVGNTLSSVTVAADQYLEDAYGGAVSGLTIAASGTAELLGGTVSGAIIAGELTVAAGSATALTVLSGGNAFVNNGTVQGATISQGGTETCEYGTLTNTIISMGGLQEVYYGSATNTVVLHGGVQNVDGGKARDTTISAGGTVVLDHGGLIDTNFAAGGTIELNTATYVSGATVSLNSSTDVLTIVEGGFYHDTSTLQLTGNYAGETFHITSNSQGGTMITLSAAGAALRDPALAHELTPGGYAAPHADTMIKASEARPPLAGAASVAAPVSETAIDHVVLHVT